jgi:hypothetical protein
MLIGLLIRRFFFIRKFSLSIFRKMTARSNKFSGIFAANSLNHAEPTNSNHNPGITFQDPSIQSYFK